MRAGKEKEIRLIKCATVDSCNNLYVGGDRLARYDINGVWKVFDEKALKDKSISTIATRQNAIGETEVYFSSAYTNIGIQKITIPSICPVQKRNFIFIIDSYLDNDKAVKRLSEYMSVAADSIKNSDEVRLIYYQHISDTLDIEKYKTEIEEDDYKFGTLIYSNTKEYNDMLLQNIQNCNFFYEKDTTTSSFKKAYGIINKKVQPTSLSENINLIKPEKIKNRLHAILRYFTLIINNEDDTTFLHNDYQNVLIILSYGKNYNKISVDIDSLRNSNLYRKGALNIHFLHTDKIKGDIRKGIDDKLESFIDSANIGKYYSIKEKHRFLNETFDIDYPITWYVGFKASSYTNILSNPLPTVSYSKILRQNIINDANNNLFSGSNFNFILSGYYRDKSKKLRFGGTFSFGFVNTWKTDLSIQNFNADFSATDKDLQTYTKLINSSQINEKVKYKSPYTSLSADFKIPLGQRLELYINGGYKLIYRNVIKYENKGRYTFKGAYDEYGGIEFPLHSLDDYHFFNDTLVEANGNFNWTTNSKGNFFAESGMLFSFGKDRKVKLRIGISADWLKDYNSFVFPDVDKNYQIIRDTDNVNSVFKASSFEYEIQKLLSMKASFSILYRLDNKTVRNIFSRNH